MATEKKLDIVQKYYIRKENGEIDYSHGYDFIKEDHCKGLYYVRQGDTIGYMNAEGEFVVPLNYDFTRKTVRGDTHHKYSGWPSWASVPNTNMVVTDVFKDNQVGLIDSLGNELVPCQFEDVSKDEVSKDFAPITLPTPDDVPKLVMGLYDIPHKKVCVTPQYNCVLREWNGYSPFQKGETWGLLHCKTGIEVVPPIYLLDFTVNSNGIAIAFLGGSWEYGRNCKNVSPEDCHVLVTHGTSALRILSGYKWIKFTGPSVVSCWSAKYWHRDSDPHDTFKILKMPNYIALIQNAQYQKGYFQKDGKFVEKWNCDCITDIYQSTHARYLHGGTFLAKDYEGRDIPVTSKMELEILGKICE